MSAVASPRDWKPQAYQSVREREARLERAGRSNSLWETQPQVIDLPLRRLRIKFAIRSEVPAHQTTTGREVSLSQARTLAVAALEEAERRRAEAVLAEAQMAAYFADEQED